MEYKVLAVHDRALDAYLRPEFLPAIGAAVRSFQDAINTKDSPLAAHPDDFDLYHIGNWNDHTAEFRGIQPPIKIAIGKQLVIKKE